MQKSLDAIVNLYNTENYNQISEIDLLGQKSINLAIEKEIPYEIIAGHISKIGENINSSMLDKLMIDDKYKQAINTYNIVKGVLEYEKTLLFVDNLPNLVRITFQIGREVNPNSFMALDDKGKSYFYNIVKDHVIELREVGNINNQNNLTSYYLNIYRIDNKDKKYIIENSLNESGKKTTQLAKLTKMYIEISKNMSDR